MLEGTLLKPKTRHTSILEMHVLNV